MYYACTLSPGQKQLYKQLTSGLLAYSGQIRLDTSPPCTIDDLRATWKAVKLDHPELMHVNWWQYRHSNDLWGNPVCVIPDYIIDIDSAQEYRDMLRQFENSVSMTDAAVPPIIRYFALADSITSRVTYTNSGSLTEHSMLGVLHGRAVCEGIAATFLHLCQINQLPAMIIHSATHSWNAIEVQNNIYQIDLTSRLGKPLTIHDLWDPQQARSHNLLTGIPSMPAQYSDRILLFNDPACSSEPPATTSPGPIFPAGTHFNAPIHTYP